MIDIDILIVGLFLVSTMIVGLTHGKKVANIEDYALGGRSFSTGALVATIVATYASGSGFFIILSRTYSDGLFFLAATLFMGVSLFITGKILVPRMQEFLGDISVADTIGNLYGKNARIITAIAGIIAAVGGIAVQFKAFGSIISYFSATSSDTAIVVSGAIVIMYSAFGGIRAVTLTDVLQLCTFGFVVPIIAILIWNDFYYQEKTFDVAMKFQKFSFGEVFNWHNPKFVDMFLLILYFIIPGFGPSIYQRVLIGKDIAQIKKAFIISALLFTLVILAIAWIPFLIFNLDQNLPTDHLIGHIINNYTFAGIKGLLIIGVIAMAMSTADSHINISSVLFANDVCAPLRIGKNKELIISRIFSVLLGIGAIFLALSETDLLSIVLSANAFYMPVVTVPLLLTILGFRTSKISIIKGMLTGFAVVVAWKIFKVEGDPIIYGMIINFTVIMANHYMNELPGGWIAVKKVESEGVDWSNKIVQIKTFNLVNYCKKKSPNNELSYVSLGAYFIIFALTTMYITQPALLTHNRGFILGLYQLMLVTGTVTVMYPVWPMSVKHEIKLSIAQVIWPIVIFYMLILCNTFFMLISNFHPIQLSLFSINMVLVPVLVGWRTSLIMITLGMTIVAVIYNNFYSHYNVDFSIGSPGFISAYMLMIIGATTVLFIKPKQEYLEETEAKVGTLENEVTHLSHELTDLNGQVNSLNKQVGGLNEQVDDLSGQVDHYSQRVSDHEQEIERLGATAQKILNNVNHELRLPIGNVVNFSDMLHEALQKSDNYSLKELSEEVFKNSTRVSTMILNMLDLATLEVKNVDLQKKTINFGELVETRVRHCRKIYLQGKKIDFELSIQPEVMIAVDPNYIRQMVDNIVINALSYSEEGLIKVNVYKVSHRVELVIEDQGMGIPFRELYDIFDPFKMGSKTDSKAEGRGVGLALCKSVAEAHDGKITAESNGKRGARFTVTLPF